MAKRHQRHAAPLRQTRTRTRQNKGGALISDPAQNTQQLGDQLRAMGLYPAQTLGDGNCLFRALSDQYYGTPSQHLKLREEICNWLEEHKQRYAPFVDDDRGLDVHLRCMRQPGTYGGHLELTAFAHLKKRDVKVIQPGLVYVIEWTSGADLSPTTSEMPKPDPPADADPQSSRETRKARRDKKRDLKVQALKNRQDAEDEDDDSQLITPGAVYVAYHDWEHFSSVRNLTGPHAGLPYVVEKPSEQNRELVPQQQPSNVVETSSSGDLFDVSDDEESNEENTESDPPSSQAPDLPLPLSRSASPAPSSTDSNLSSLSLPPLPGYDTLGSSPESRKTAAVKLALRIQQSPKRSFDESSGPYGDSSDNSAKRSRTFSRAGERMNVDPEADTPELLASGSSGEESSSPASSPAATPPPSMVIVPPSPLTNSKPLTRRQRKVLGLPKPRDQLPPPSRGSAGKIVIPGGRHKKFGAAASRAASEAPAADPGAWEKNGSGRLDVRGFKELKI